jgi:hypothetical protein
MPTKLKVKLSKILYHCPQESLKNCQGSEAPRLISPEAHKPPKLIGSKAHRPKAPKLTGPKAPKLTGLRLQSS